jgi:hypothetical protein
MATSAPTSRRPPRLLLTTVTALAVLIPQPLWFSPPGGRSSARTTVGIATRRAPVHAGGGRSHSHTEAG